MSSRPARTDEDRRARVELGNAVQWLARVTRSYAAGAGEEPRLLFDRETRRLLTPDLAPDIQLGLYLPSLILQFVEHGSPTPHPLDLDGRSSTEVEAWLLAELLHRGFDRSTFDQQLPYEWEGPMSGDEVRYASHRLSQALDRLTRELVEVAALLETARHVANGGDDVAASSGIFYSPARCGMGLRLPFALGTVEVMHERTDGESMHFRLSRLSAGEASSADVRVPNTSDAGACPGRQIADVSKRLVEATAGRRGR